MRDIIFACYRIGTNALSNEFLTNACNEWRERLSEGDIFINFILPWRQQRKHTKAAFFQT